MATITDEFMRQMMTTTTELLYRYPEGWTK